VQEGAKDNARLIAAAPDLLELLEQILVRLELEKAEYLARGERPVFILAARIDDIKTAITKAKGEA
jgi:hypothetical protein